MRRSRQRNSPGATRGRPEETTTTIYAEPETDRFAELYDALLPIPPLPSRSMPLAPLLARFGDDTAALAKAAGVSRRQVQRWAKAGLPYLKADRVCCKVNEFPAHVWLDWADDDPVEDVA